MARGTEKKSGGMKGQMIMIFMIIVSVVFLPTSVLLFIGMMPTLVAIIADRSRKKTKAVTVGAMNLAGCAPFLLRLLEQGHDLRNALEIVSDPTAIVVMYAAAAVGYLIDWSVAGLVANILFQKAISRQKAIKERQKAMVERWGMEVSGQIPLDPHGFPLDMGQNPVNSKGRDID